MGKFIGSFSEKIAAIDKNKYLRNSAQTYTTGPEWRNVEMSEEFASTLEDGKPFYRYPFFSQVVVFWKVFFQSYKAAHREHGLLGLIFADHMLMNLFVGITCTIEFASKGIVSLFLWPILRNENKTEFQTHLAAVFRDYADFIHHTPFYNYHYFSDIRSLFSNFWHSKDKSLADVISLLVVGFDFLLHGIIASPVGFWYNQEANKEAETIDIIVKQKTDENPNEPLFKQEFSQKIAAIPHVSVVSENAQTHLFTRHSENPDKHRLYAYAHLRVPRYEGFRMTIEKLTEAGINVRSIAGNEHVQFKCLVTADDAELLTAKEEALSSLEGCTKLYSYKNRVDSNQTFFTLDVHTKHLNHVVEEIAQLEGVSIKLIHDF